MSPVITKRVLAYETETVVIVWTYKVGDEYRQYEQTVRIPPKDILKAREGAA